MTVNKKNLYVGSTKISAVTDVSTQISDDFDLSKYMSECLYSWVGKKVAFLGDSITFGTNTDKTFHSYLQDILGVVPTNYGIAGAMWKHTELDKDIKTQAQSALSSGIDFDAIIIMCGTNDFYNNVTIGEWYNEEEYQTQIGDRGTIKKRVLTDASADTERGYINDALIFIKQNFTTAQVILVTPIHRGAAGYKVMGTTYPLDDEFASNKNLNYLDDFVNTIREASSIWSCPLIDLYSDSGILAWMEEYGLEYMNVKDDETYSDSLHPSRYGHYRMARVIASKLISIPCGKFIVNNQ